MNASRICIIGGPRTGKTTLAGLIAPALRVLPRGTDSLVGVLEWSDASLMVASWFAEPGPWVIEGVAVVRALRKWLVAHPEGKPCDRVVLLTVAHEHREKGAESMAKGHDTIWAEVEPLLVARGVSIVRDVDAKTAIG